MASRKRINNWGQVTGLVIVLIGFCILMSFGLVLRDYELRTTTDGVHWVAKTPVPHLTSLTLKSEKAGKLEMSTREVSGVEGYEFRVSRFKNMWFSKTYRTTKTSKELGMMKEGKTYYVQVRGYKKNSGGRTVFGLYSGKKGCTIRRNMSKAENKNE